MTPPNPPARAPRGCVIYVGEVPEANGAEAPDRRVIHADNLFDAVGEVTVATASQPVEAVVVPVDLVRRTASITAEAFRRIDPSVRLFLLASSAAEADGLDDLTEGFDDVLVAPLAPAALAAALRDNDRPDATASNGPRRDDDPASAVPAIEIHPADVPPAATGQPLGDTDLVEAVMIDPAGLRQRALELMVEQTEWSDLALVDQGPTDAAASVEVRYGRTCYGVLCSTQAGSAERLRPWAEWLARWLALDRGYRDFRTWAFEDDLTGAGNRRFYNMFMQQTIRKAARMRRAVTVLVFDIDDFKRYNDEFGHEAGDEVLCETVRLLKSVIRSGDRVCRIGGDEFVVIFADPEGPRELGSNPPETVEAIATRFQDQICKMKFPKLGLDAPGTLSVSGGLATYPWDGADPVSLLNHADQLALQSKKKGKNVITIGPGAEK